MNDIWYPISSSPRDGTNIRIRGEGKSYITVMRWDKVLNSLVGTQWNIFGSHSARWPKSVPPMYEWQYCAK
jgi:hypothetical protein